MDEDMNFVKEGRKQSRVCKAAADTVNKELNPRSGDHHRRSNLRHRGKPPLTTTPQLPNPPALLSSGRCPPIVSKQRGREREGGVGMQAFFLDSGKRSSCGTGVFLPQTNLTKKTACAPVLLPSRVVQALKLNVQAIGVQISQKQDAKARSTSFSVVKSRNHGGKHETIECGRGVSPTPSSTAPADIFLPKEWTY